MTWRSSKTFLLSVSCSKTNRHFYFTSIFGRCKDHFPFGLPPKPDKRRTLDPTSKKQLLLILYFVRPSQSSTMIAPARYGFAFSPCRLRLDHRAFSIVPTKNNIKSNPLPRISSISIYSIRITAYKFAISK